MQTLLVCPSLLGDGVPCQQTTTSPADLPPGPRNPVSVPLPSLLPTGDNPVQGLLRPHWSPTCVCPASMQSRDLSPLHRTFAHMHTHECIYTMPMTIPSHSAPHPGNTGKTLISAGCPGQRGLSGLSCSSPCPLQCPRRPLTACWVPGTWQPCSLHGVGRRAGGPEEGEGVGAGL